MAQYVKKAAEYGLLALSSYEVAKIQGDDDNEEVNYKIDNKIKEVKENIEQLTKIVKDNTESEKNGDYSTRIKIIAVTSLVLIIGYNVYKKMKKSVARQVEGDIMRIDRAANQPRA